VITAPDHAITHIYRTPFLRSSDLILLRAERPLKPEGRPAALINLSRPRGYFGLPRDEIGRGRGLDGPARTQRGCRPALFSEPETASSSS